MNALLRNALVVAGLVLATHAVAQVTLYEREGFDGRSFTTGQRIENLQSTGFNDRASSVVIEQDSWEVCQDASFGGRCMTLRPGRYSSVDGMGLNDAISSLRVAGDTATYPGEQPVPAPIVMHDFGRRDYEPLFRAYVTSARAVVSTPEGRCWVEHEQIRHEQSIANGPAAVAAALVGGVLGHEVGQGRDQYAASVGGRTGYSRDIPRCVSAPTQTGPDYWEVTYSYKGLDHRMQMTVPPDRTVTVNEAGEPRM